MLPDVLDRKPFAPRLSCSRDCLASWLQSVKCVGQRHDTARAPHVLHVKTVIQRYTLFTLPTTTVFAALLPLPSRLCFRFFILLGVFESHCLITHPLQLPKNVCNNAYHWQDLVTPRQDRIRQSCKVVNCAIRHITVALNLHSSNCLLDFEVGDPHYRHYWSCP